MERGRTPPSIRMWIESNYINRTNIDDIIRFAVVPAAAGRPTARLRSMCTVEGDSKLCVSAAAAASAINRFRAAANSGFFLFMRRTFLRVCVVRAVRLLLLRLCVHIGSSFFVLFAERDKIKRQTMKAQDYHFDAYFLFVHSMFADKRSQTTNDKQSASTHDRDVVEFE